MANKDFQVKNGLLINGPLTFGGNQIANTNTLWHSGNDGTGSGLDADKLDGVEYSAIASAIAAKQDDLGLESVEDISTLLANKFAPRRVGEFFWYFASSPPDYALVCDGSAISRTTYADLWAFAQASGNLAASEASKQAGQFGPGNGSSTFTLPDLRREFIRGVYSGRGFGSWQTDEIRSHSHHIPGKILSGNGWGVAGPDGERGDWFRNDSYTSPYGGDETRPRNVALLPCIVF